MILNRYLTGFVFAMIGFVGYGQTVTFTSASQSSTDETGTMTITAQLSATIGSDVTVPFTVNGSSTATGGGTDYTITASPITITAGNTTADITITIATDVLDENDETVIVDMGTPTNATQGATTTHTATITDDDAAPTVTFTSASQSSTDETGTMTITAQLSGASGKDVTVPFTVNGSSTATGGGTDYSITASPLSITAGNTTADITITIATDAIDENDETVIVDMGTPTNATQGATTTHTATITDDDAAPTVTFTSASQSSTDETGTMTITAQLSGASSKDVTVPFTVNGSSTATGGGTDYSITASPLSITAGNTTADITITIATDVLDENDETVIVDMGTPTNATQGATTTHTSTITDDDPAPTVTLGIDNASIIENVGVATITATSDAVSGLDVVVNLDYSSSTATGGGVDYNASAPAASITISAGTTSNTKTITAVQDATSEPGDETVVVDISSVTNGTESGTQQVSTTIFDDDSRLISIGVDNSTITEPGTSTVTATLTGGVSDFDIIVNLAYSGTAIGGGTDYSVSASSITISAGNTFGTATITSVDDGTDEPNETVIVDITSVSNATEDGVQQSTVTIDGTTQDPSLTDPATESHGGPEFAVNFALPEAANPGSVLMTFTNTSGANDKEDPHVITFTSLVEGAGSHSFTLYGPELTENSDATTNTYVDNVVSDKTKHLLKDGAFYSIKLEYEDVLVNPVASVTNTNFFYESEPLEADIIDISPDPTNAAVGIVTIHFNKGIQVSTVDQGDFELTLDEGSGPNTVDITSATVIATVDSTYSAKGTDYSTQFTMDMSSFTTKVGSYVLTLPVSSGLQSPGGSPLSADASDAWVIDRTKPNLNSVSIASDNSNPTVVGAGGIVTVSFTASEGLQDDPVVTINGHGGTDVSVAKVNGSALNWTASYVMGSSVNPSPDVSGNAVTFNIQFNDLAGNAGDPVSVTSNSSSVIYDNSPPSLTVNDATNNFKSNNSTDASFARAGDVLTLTFTSNEGLKDVTVVMEGITAVSSNVGNFWTSQLTVPGNIDPNAGLVDFTIAYSDSAGNPGTVVTQANYPAYPVTIDVTAPNKPSQPDLIDDFYIDGDNITSATSPDIQVSAETGATVIFYSNVVAGDLGTATEDSTGWYSLSPALANGDHIITATATDGAGNVSPISTSLTITIDGIPPAEAGTPDMDANSDSGISNSDNITSDRTPTLAGKVEKNAHVYIYRGGTTLIGETDADIFGSWSHTLATDLLNGVYDISVRARDLAGNLSPVTSDSILTIEIDYLPPAVPIAPPVLDSDSDTGIPGDNKTKDVTPTFTGTVVPFNYIVTLYSDDGSGNPPVERGTYISDGSGDWSITSSELADDNYDITHKITDVAGNTSNASPPEGITIDNTAPVAPLGPTVAGGLDLTDASDDGREIDDNITSEQVPVFQGTAEKNATVKLYSNLFGSDSIGFAIANPITGTWTITSNATLGGGIHSFTATATDEAGNTSVVSEALSVTIDITKPNAPGKPDLDAGSDSGSSIIDNNTNDNTPTFKGIAEVGSNVRLFSDGVVQDSVIVVDGTWEITAGTLTDGVHSITADATDLAGNTSDLSAALSITIDTGNPLQPGTPDLDTASDTGNPDTDNITKDETPSFSGFAEAGSNVELLNEVDEILGTGVADGTTGDWAITASSMSPGNHVITVIATDTAGNPSPESAGLNITIDISAPNQPGLPVLQAASDNGVPGDNITNDSTPTITGNAELDSYVNIYSNNVNIATVTTDGTGAYSYTFGTLADGTYSIRSVCVDKAGNSSVSSNILIVTIDTQLPDLSSVSIVSNNPKTGWAKVTNTVSLSFTSSESIQDPVVDIDGKSVVLSGGPTFWTASRTMDGTENQGKLSFSVEYTDIAGNAGDPKTETSDLSEVKFDSIRPDITAISIKSDHSNTDKARVGSAVTIDFTSTETIENIQVKINGKVALLENPSGNDWNATSYLASGDVEGPVSFSMDYSDEAGNPGATKTHTTDGSQVEFDKTFPGFNNLTIYSNNDNPVFAVAGDTVFMEFTTDEDIENPSVFINGFTYDEISGGPTDWLALRELQLGENEGVIPINVSIIDLAGNAAATKFNTTDGSSVTFDDSNPGISSVSVSSGVYKVGDVISILIQTDGVNYVGETVEVNGKTQTLVNKLNTNYTIDYLVEENDAEHTDIASLPVNIVLKDPAGLTTSRTSAVALGGLISIDSKTPLISSFTSNAEGFENAIIGDQIIFTLEPVVAETGLIITPATYNGQSLNWSTTDGSAYTGTYTVEEGDTERDVPLQIGTVTLADAAGNSDQISYTSVNKSIYANYPSVTIEGSTSKCDYGQTVPITFKLTGTKPFELTYNNGSADVGPKTVDGSTYIINETEGTFTLVNLTDSTGNFVTDAEQDAAITVIPLPVVTTDYVNSPYNIDSPVDTLELYVLQEDKRSGIFSADAGIGFLEGKYLFDVNNVPPDLQDKDLEIVYTYTDPVTGCFTRDTNSVFVSSSPVGIQGLENVYCEYAEKDTVRGILPVQHTGEFVVIDADSVEVSSGWSMKDSVTLFIYPQDFTPGTYSVIYSAIKLPERTETEFRDSREFTIEAVRTGIAFEGLLDEYCFDDNALDVQIDVNFDPNPGDLGYFFGSDIFEQLIAGSHNAIMNLSNAEEEATYTLNYIFTSVNGCVADTVTKDVYINPLPKLSFDLDPNYNFDIGNIPLEGVSSIPLVTEGFTGNGVSRDTIFTAAASVKTPIIITYAGVDAKGCSNEVEEATIIYRADESIDGINEDGVYCFDEDLTLDISVTPDPVKGPGIVGSFSSYRGEIESTGTNTARYYANKVGSGPDTVFFDYSVAGTSYRLMKSMFIDSVGQVYISTIKDNFDYCHSDPLDQLSGQWTGDAYEYGGQGTFTYYGSGDPKITRSSSTTINPPDETPGSYQLNYIFESSSGCSTDTTVTVRIFPVPIVNFGQGISCPDIETPIPFKDSTVFNGGDQTLTYNWKIEDATLASKNPVYTFKSNGVKIVNLTVTTSDGCSAELSKSYEVGNFALANFTWDNECSNGDSITFVSTSEGGVPELGDFVWKYNDEVISEATLAKYKFTKPGNYDVNLQYTSNAGCTDEITKSITIQPYIRIVADIDSKSYLEDFESGNKNYNWQARGFGETDTSRWKLGIPDGDVIDAVASGQHSWFTSLTDKTDVENSVVVSPCFDLTGLEKPMIKMNIWSSSEFKRDGAVLQYSVDNGKSWPNLGSIGEGINWFNSENVQSQPGGEGQFEGWNEVKMIKWESSRHNLDTLKGADNVRFRVAYAADGGGVEDVDGFAFDDVWIGEREQNVLLEYFTNNQISESGESDNYVLDYEEERIEDIIPIHYHTSNPAGDPINEDYSAGPSARVFYYGVSQAPYGIANGVSASSISDASIRAAFENSIDVESLKDPKLDIQVSASKQKANLTLRANENLSNKNLVIYAAVVKDSLETEDGKYYNILRKFIPDAAGQTINTSEFEAGTNIEEDIKLGLNADMTVGSHLVLFVQNTDSKEVYQSVSLDMGALGISSENYRNILVDIYPNPTRKILFIDSEEIIEELIIVDISGKILEDLKPETDRLNLNVEEYAQGVYFLKGKTRSGEFIKKFLKN